MENFFGRNRPVVNSNVLSLLGWLTVWGVFSWGTVVYPAGNPTRPDKVQVMEAMRQATEFMMNEVSYRGGFVQRYSLDLSERYGELPARETQVWVEPPATPSVGLVMLEAHRRTGEPQYISHARRIADCLIWGQLESGGWHYFIDFDLATVPHYYDEVLSQYWGWEEYSHYYGNATFDDDTTAAAIRLLLRLYDTTQDPRYRIPLKTALDFVLEAQYPNGAWPERYPRSNRVSGNPKTDYTAFYTFNDSVISSNIMLLLEAHKILGDSRYWEAARRGMDFYIISQQAQPQAGWAQQYDFEMQPARGRSFELPALNAAQTATNIKELLLFFKVTGDRRYLEPVPKALDWLEASQIDSEPPYTFTYFYEMVTNRPIYTRRVGDDKRSFRFVETYESEGAYPYGLRFSLDIPALRSEFERVGLLTAADTRKEYEHAIRIERTQPIIQRPDALVDYRTVAADAAEIGTLIDALDERGGWPGEYQMLDLDDWLDNPPRRYKGYDTGTYVTRMYRLINYLDELEGERELGSQKSREAPSREAP